MAYAFLYDPTLSNYELSDSHPFKPIRLELTKSLLEHIQLLSTTHLVQPFPIKETQLLEVHTKDYVEAVKAVSKGLNIDDAYSYGLGTSDNPIFPNMHEAIMRVCSATTTAVHLVASGQVQRAVNLSGGLHHAHVDKASGFCVYNDLAVAIHHATKTFKLRVAYVDIDAHHGDGVQWLFYDRADVMTISLHESGRYLFPGTGHTYEIGKDAGRGYSVNMPLEPFSEDKSYLEAFEAVVPLALKKFKPDLIVLQAGADMHRYDPLADLSLSLQAISQSYQRISELADELCNGRLVATGGGGYDPYRTVPRAWAHLWAAVSKQTLLEDVPEAWRTQWQTQSPTELPKKIHDNLTTWPDIPRRSEIESHNRAVMKRLVNTLESTWRE
ncbi:MAG: acetoin utilization protein AcuC [Trueperaceae bacterium]